MSAHTWIPAPGDMVTIDDGRRGMVALMLPYAVAVVCFEAAPEYIPLGRLSPAR